MSRLITPDEFSKLSTDDIQMIIKGEVPLIVARTYHLGKKYYWCSFREAVIKKGKLEDIEIDLTKKEKLFIKLLIESKKEIVTYDDIQKKVWNSKKASLFTIRNFVKNIRDKTYYDLILNKSGIGYSINKI